MKSDSDWKTVIKMESMYISYFTDLKKKTVALETHTALNLEYIQN